MLTTFIAVLLRRWKVYTTYLNTKYELNKLTNSDLADLGIARCDIEFIAREHSKNAGKIAGARVV